ncbi:hypothetical protein KJ966_31480 [bacterium]|nr:hypothetical protein [bacterium]
MTRKLLQKLSLCKRATFKKVGIVWATSLIMSGYYSLNAQNILIFSTSHNNEQPTEVSAAEGLLKIEISTFTPIVKLSVNDESKTPQAATRATVDVPYSLQPGDNSFAVYVKTEAIEERKEFILTLLEEDESQKPKEKKPWQVIAILALTSTSNAENAASDEQADSKYAYTIIPSYQQALFGSHKLRLKGVLMREKFSNSDFEDQELVYNQIGLGWLSESSSSDWEVELGWADVGTKNVGGTSDTDVETGTSIGGKIGLTALDDKNIIFSGKYTLKDQTSSTTSDDYDGDGGLLAFGVKWKKKFGQLSGYLKGGVDSNDSKGKYKDYTAMHLGFSATYGLGKNASVGGLLSSRQTAYAENDPAKGDTETSLLTTITFNGSYKLNVLGGIIFLGDITQKQKTSNIEGFEYTTSLVTVSVVYIF